MEAQSITRSVSQGRTHLNISYEFSDDDYLYSGISREY